MTRHLCAGALSALVMLAASPASADPDCSLEEGCYLDIDGRLRDPYAEYARHHRDRHPGHLLTIGQSVLILAGGTLWYWLDRERNSVDWDYPSWKQRFTLDAWRWDNNEFPINYLGHVMSGASYYALPRANDHGFIVSMTYSLITSFLWEFLIEFREKTSINDMLVTTYGGMPLGEFAHKFWRYLNGLPGEPSLLQKILAPSLGWPKWMHRVFYDPPRPGGPYDKYGYSTAIKPRLELGYQMRLHDYGDQVVTHGGWIGGRISSIPGEGLPGTYSLFFHDADVTSVKLAAGLGRGAREFELTSDMHLLGLYTQALDRDLDGHAATIALSLAYRYRFRDYEGYNDRYGLLHLPGPGADYTVKSGPVQLDTSWRLSHDFAGIHAAAYPAWAADTLREGDKDKTILNKHKYYYGWGISSRFGLGLTAKPFDARADLLIGGYDSQEGLDRNQEELTHDQDAVDRIFEIDTSLGLTVPSTHLRLGVGWCMTDRRSRVEHSTVDRTLHIWTTSIGLSL